MQMTGVDDTYRLTRPSSYTGPAWIGLSDDPACWYKVMNSEPNSWRWSATESSSASQYQMWKSNKPENLLGNAFCVFMLGGVWVDSEVGGAKEFTLVEEAKTWDDAVAHCRQHYKDLAMIETEAENAEVDRLVGGNNNKAWIGLYRNAWMWSDKSSSTFTNWAPKQPDNSNVNEYCAVEQADHSWDDVGCEALYPFFCREELNKRITLTKVKVQTPAEMSQPRNGVQLSEQLKLEFRRKDATDIQITLNIHPLEG
ncbi:hypothetical protein WMY93_026922 [Mugilogobius chulae]|uniref:C-type lectin domain-containing protein n=1 Tax=Mugilogobius chulae TaxID=88201 RepID=A0AAW0MY92_9GOBI